MGFRTSLGFKGPHTPCSCHGSMNLAIFELELFCSESKGVRVSASGHEIP